MDAQALFSELCHRLHVYPNREGKVEIACPSCGRERGHFRFDLAVLDGKEVVSGHCFACGFNAGPKALMALVGLAPDYEPLRPLPRIAPKPQQDGPKGIFKLSITPDGLATRWADHPETVARWQAYCPPLTAQTIEDAMFGYGTFPEFVSRCDKPRLMVPFFKGDHVVGFRGRLAGKSCGKCPERWGKKCAKWLSAAGSKPVLYGAETIAAGKPCSILESPVEAKLLHQMGRAAVATCGVGMWKPEWTEVVRKASRILIVYDNDPAGNGGTDEARAQWFAEHPNTPATLVAGGAHLANILLSDGCKNVRLYEWPKGSKTGMDVREAMCATT